MMSRAVPTKTPPRPKKLFKHGRMDVNRPRARWRAVSTEAEDGGAIPLLFDIAAEYRRPSRHDTAVLRSP